MSAAVATLNVYSPAQMDQAVGTYIVIQLEPLRPDAQGNPPPDALISSDRQWTRAFRLTANGGGTAAPGRRSQGRPHHSKSDPIRSNPSSLVG